MKIEFVSRKAENRFLPILCIYMLNMLKILRARLHYHAIVTSYENGRYLFWYQWKGETHSYALVANISKGVLQKMSQEDEGL